MNLYVIRRPSGWRTPEELQAAAARSKQVGDAWVPETQLDRSHAAALYSWMSPPSTSRRWMPSRVRTVFGSRGGSAIGGRCWRDRWGRCAL
jgi:hypothetical protein